MLEKVTLSVSLGHLSLYIPSKISQKHSGQRYGKAKGSKTYTETIQNVNSGESDKEN